MELLILNFVLYLILGWYVLKSKMNGRYIMILPILFFISSSFCSIMYYDSTLYPVLSEAKVDVIQFVPLLYIYICFIIYLLPIKSLPYIKDANSKYELRPFKILLYLGLFLGVLSIIPLIENLSRIGNLDFNSMADAYNDNQVESVDTRGHLSGVGHFCNGVLLWFRPIILPLFFYLICFYRNNKYVVVLLSLAYINNVLPSIMHGGRGGLFSVITGIFLNFVIFYKYFSPQTMVLVKRVGVISLSVVIFMLFGMTLARAEGDSNMMFDQIFRYQGEGFVNFAETGWFVKTHTEGHSIFNGTGYTFWRYISDYFDSRDYMQLSTIANIKMWVYYTAFGDYYIDFGFWGGLLCDSIIALLFYYSIKSRETMFSSIILINMYLSIGINGIRCHVFMNKTDLYLFIFFVIYIIRLLEIKHYKLTHNCSL